MPIPKLTQLDRGQTKESQALQRGLARSKPEAITSARKLLFLCKAVDLTEEPLYKGPALQRALWRYEALWLPILVATSPAHAARPIKHSTAFERRVEELRAKNFAKGGLFLERKDLVPPLDIAWIWHCHRLDPHLYASDIEALTEGGGPIDSTWENAFTFSDGEDAQSKRLRMLWRSVYPFEPFMPKYLLSHSYEEDERIIRQKIPSYANAKARAAFPSVINIRQIERISAIQRTFLYQLVGSDGPPTDPATTPGALNASASTTKLSGTDSTANHVSESLIETNEYLGRAYDRYLLFLALHKHAPEGALLVPMVDINVMWHAHLSCSFEYRTDCQVILGYLLKHDPVSVEDRRNRHTQALLDVSAVAAYASEGHNRTSRTSAVHTANSVGHSSRNNSTPLAAVPPTADSNIRRRSGDKHETDARDARPNLAFNDGASQGMPQQGQSENDSNIRSVEAADDNAVASKRSNENSAESKEGQHPWTKRPSGTGQRLDKADFEDLDDVASLGLPSVELAELTEDEISHLVEKRRRGVNIKETKKLWESTYGSKPRYDLPDSLYRGEPEGDRGGFYDLFVTANGTSKDIPWYYAFALMVLAALVCLMGLFVSIWAFFQTMLMHGKYLVGLPAGLLVSGFGVFIFLSIPINRPLSSDARYWRDRDLKHAHNPLPPYLISSTKME